MEAWPEYAKILRDSFEPDPESALTRTPTESGPPKQTRIKSRVMVSIPVRVRLQTKTDYLAFLAWHRTNLRHGADWFSWTHPVTGLAIQARIVNGKIGPARPVGGLERWELPMTLEYWDA